MSLVTILKTTIHIFYRLTVGLTVLILQTGLLYLICFLTLAGWIVLVGLVTWKTYAATQHHLGWTLLACGLAVLVCGGGTVGLHYVAKEKLRLTSLSLSQLVAVVFLGRLPEGGGPHLQTSGSGGDDGSHHTGGTAQHTVQVTTRRKVIVGHSSSVQTRSAET